MLDGALIYGDRKIRAEILLTFRRSDRVRARDTACPNIATYQSPAPLAGEKNATSIRACKPRAIETRALAHLRLGSFRRLNRRFANEPSEIIIKRIRLARDRLAGCSGPAGMTAIGMTARVVDR